MLVGAVLGSLVLVLGPLPLSVALLFLLPWVLLSLAAGFYAVRLDRSMGWLFTALLLSPPVAFALLFALGPKRNEDDERMGCPCCAEDVKLEAVICHHCRSDLDRPAGRIGK